MPYVNQTVYAMYAPNTLNGLDQEVVPTPAHTRAASPSRGRVMPHTVAAADAFMADLNALVVEQDAGNPVAGVRVRAPMMLIHTVAAGGGSILHFDAGRFRVGPDSAGADPGPACYRRGGPLAVTDANLMLGKLQPDYFPAIFGPNQDQRLDVEVVRQKFEALAAEVGDRRSAEEVADGFVTIAVASMAEAVKKISVRRGYDVTSYALNCFGGAGGQHACLVADALGMKTVLVHPYSGLLSAYGMGLAAIRAVRQKALDVPLDEEAPAAIAALADALAAECLIEVSAQGVSGVEAERFTRAHIRYGGTDTTITVPVEGDDAMLRGAFESLHAKRFGFVAEGKPLVVEAIEVEIVGA